MTDLFLIAHKVRGEPAFDVACHMTCAICNGKQIDDVEGESCVECDGYGFWWIIPTSGHRAYPWWHCAFTNVMCDGPRMPSMPPALPDHYTSRATTVVPSGLAALLAKRKPLNVERRGR